MYTIDIITKKISYLYLLVENEATVEAKRWRAEKYIHRFN